MPPKGAILAKPPTLRHWLGLGLGLLLRETFSRTLRSLDGWMAIIKDETLASRKNADIGRLGSALVVKVGKLIADSLRWSQSTEYRIMT